MTVIKSYESSEPNEDPAAVPDMSPQVVDVGDENGAAEAAVPSNQAASVVPSNQAASAVSFILHKKKG